MIRAFARHAAFAGVTLAIGLAASGASAQTVNIYSYRQPDLIKPVLDAFTAETGIKTEVLFLDKGLEDRIAAEGTNSPADVIMTVDIARLTNAKAKEVTQPLDDATVNANIRPNIAIRKATGSASPSAPASSTHRRIVSATARSPMPTSPIRSGRARSASALASTTTIWRSSRPPSHTGARPRRKSG